MGWGLGIEGPKCEESSTCQGLPLAASPRRPTARLRGTGAPCSSTKAGWPGCSLSYPGFP